MLTISNSIILLIAVLHGYFLILEMFLWDKPIGMRVFGNSLEKAQHTKILAANQGLYNGFLAAGLLWSLTIDTNQTETKIFFLTCVIIAGLFGAYTANLKILWIQALPAFIGLGFTVAASY
ncbi:DUF1304 domain-containing protein [Neptunicella sp.]|uniref:DUF1304 domain-containing protein n=1 Tax=Neptunicella sp. TaxID=2125986 RepID=UPI003F68EEF7